MALEMVFNHFPPIKFAFTGRLDMTDVTGDCFYITRVSLTRQQLDNNMFPILEDLVSDKCCPMWTLYLANFGNLNRQEGPQLLVKTSVSKKESLNHSEKSRRSSVRSSVVSFNREKILSPDQYLLNYVDSLKETLQQNGFSTEPTKKHHHALDEDTIRGKSRVIGQFVAKQMSGMEEKEVCSNHMLDLHINELIVELVDNIIPVGHLRVGLHLERALLFKVLADRVGLPCSLVRGWQRGWVEVCLPHLPPAPRPAYPDSLLRPSHVVDLMNNPGELLQLQSYEADLYCGVKSC
ncbi:armadillo repeat-containing protein 3 [Macrosteles quadrilineatus]|uniref:armadillo repeat-containing protein 3 n=1 Tax=Macrosteles quadrilineatus TaxID=74068 RepID=UPI0023E21B09|nr:armadillo repeat-containing protein 3 [Macrosteles quadrilineatus]